MVSEGQLHIGILALMLKSKLECKLKACKLAMVILKIISTMFLKNIVLAIRRLKMASDKTQAIWWCPAS